MFCHELENIGFSCGTGSQVGGKLAAQYVRGVKAKPVKSHCVERLDQKRAVVSFQDFISLFADPDRTSGYLQFNEKRHPPVNEGENLR